MSQRGYLTHLFEPQALEAHEESSRRDELGDEIHPGMNTPLSIGKERWQAHLFDTIFDAVVVTDVEGKVIDWNPAAERMFGYTKAEMLGRPMEELLESGIEHVEWEGFLPTLLEKETLPQNSFLFARMAAV